MKRLTTQVVYSFIERALSSHIQRNESGSMQKRPQYFHFTQKPTQIGVMSRMIFVWLNQFNNIFFQQGMEERSEGMKEAHEPIVDDFPFIFR